MDESPGIDNLSPQDQPPSSASNGEPVRRFAFLRRRWKSSLLIVAVIAALVTLIVRRSTQDATNAARIAAQEALDEDSKVKRPIDPFSFGPFTLRPSETDRVESGIKPGHWTTGSLETRANFDDFRGDLVTEMVTPTGDPVDLDGQAFRMRSSRPALLAKMQKKILDVEVFTPTHSPHRQIATRLLSSGGRDMWNARELLTLVPNEQFFFVVLAQQVEDYRYLHTLDSIWAPRGSIEDRGAQAHYRVLLPKITAAAPLPEQPLFWTNTAVVLWDSLDPKLLTPPQQQAMLDWLHWGGQLIVSGPDSLDLLRGSFLEGVLPAGPGDSWEMGTDTLAPLARVSPDDSRKLQTAQPWTGQHLNTADRAANILAEDDSNQALVAERAVGRGRTVVTAFRLTQRDLVEWPGYDALFHSLLLRGTPRRFVKSYEDKVGVGWADGVLDDSARVSQMRFFTRDAGRLAIAPPALDQMPWKGGLPPRRFSNSADPAMLILPNAGELGGVNGGVAAWDDQSQASQKARELLREAAAISVPRAMFVLYMLGAYIFVLVPLNWLVFRSLGRVEWAWVAAPLIAIVFGGLVVRLAQLDIGFDRSATEIAVVEIQPEYARAHLTRYSLLYTSLATNYSVEMASPSAVALPFASGINFPVRQSRATVTLRQEPVTTTADQYPLQLTNLAVSSNATGMVHSEEMYPLAGRLQWTHLVDSDVYRLHNGTGLDLRKVMIVIDRDKPFHIGSLAADETLDISLTARTARGKNGGERNLVPEKENAATGPLELDSLVDLAQSEVAAGEVRLIAWTGDELPGVTITPAATQSRRASIVVAHLTYGPALPIQIDFNSRAQVGNDLVDEEVIDFLRQPAENTP
ncbi:MAG TPA: hypothetical protein VGN12_13275 [Pirellulales bacterium]|jgi:hypothetical protein